MATQKLILTILPGGLLLGALLSQMAAPVMKFADQPDWRSRFTPTYSANPPQFVDVLPEEVAPAGWYGPSYTGPTYSSPVFAAPAMRSYDPVANLEVQPPALPDEADQASLDAAEAAAVLIDPAPSHGASVLDTASAEPALSDRPAEPLF